MKKGNILLYTSFILFTISLFLPVMPGDQWLTGGQPHDGIVFLMVGWLGVFFGNFSWFANVFGLIAFIVAMKKIYVAGLISATAAILLGLQNFLITYINTNYHGFSHQAYDLKVGYYVWILSFVVIFIFCLINFLKGKTINT